MEQRAFPGNANLLIGAFGCINPTEKPPFGTCPTGGRGMAFPGLLPHYMQEYHIYVSYSLAALVWDGRPGI